MNFYEVEINKLEENYDFWKCGVSVMDREMSEIQLERIRSRLKIPCKELDVEYCEPK